MGGGELFHPRGKCISPKNNNIGGYAPLPTDKIRALLVSPLPPDKLQRKLDSYQAKRIEFALDPQRIQGDTSDFIDTD
jgi:hypothetical protein